MSRFNSGAARWLLILLAAFALRAAAGVWWQSRLPENQPFFFADSDSYWVLARAIAQGEPYQYRSSDERVFRTPGYPLLMAGLFALYRGDPPLLAARLLNALFGTAAVAVVGWWTTRLFDARTGQLAGAIAAVYPGAVAMSAFVLSEAPFCLPMILQLAWWSAALRAPRGPTSTLTALGCGAAGAAATLIRPSWLLFTPLAAALIMAVGPARKQQMLRAVAILFAFVLCLAPWWIRNAQVTGRFVATTLQMGASLYDGLNPQADGSSNMSFVPQFVADERAAEGADNDGDIFEYRLDQRMKWAALDWAVAHPGRVLELAGIKLLRIWNVWPNEPSLRGWPTALVVVATYVPLLILSLLGVWRFTRGGWSYALCWLPAVYLTLLHMVFVGSIRYREPAMLALVPLAAAILAGSTSASAARVAPSAAASSS